MQRLLGEDLKKIQLEILNYVSEFCDNNNINYWLDGGTLIGAIRHKGYIPWDDDIDIGMLREDFDKFSELFNKKCDSKFIFNSASMDKTFYVPFGKVFDLDTVLYEPDENGIKTSVNIDIFVYDTIPEDEKIIKKIYDKRDRYRIMQSFCVATHIPRGNILRRIAVYTTRAILGLYPKNYFMNKIITQYRKYSKEKSTLIGNYLGYGRYVCHKSCMEGFVLVDFEGKKYKAPIGYDEWLRNVYGDYMQLPPKEQQVTHHSFVAYNNK